MKNTGFKKMCDKPRQTNIQKAREEFYESKQTLEQTIERGHQTFCEFLAEILSGKHGHITPTDGKQNKKDRL